MATPTTWVFKGDCLLVTKSEDREVLRSAIGGYEVWLRQYIPGITAVETAERLGIHYEQHGVLYRFTS